MAEQKIRLNRLNCWEFKRCGRQPGGIHEHDLGRRPATMEEKLDAVHGGRNAGRACWVVAGTLCKGEIQGTFAQKFGNCEACDFYRKVRQEEFPLFQLSAQLLSRLRNG